MNVDLKIANAKAIVDGTVAKDGRIYGLTKYCGHRVKVIVLEEKE